MKDKSKKACFIFLVLLYVLILLFIIYKALTMAATWDEALTYWRYVRECVFGDGKTLLQRISQFGNRQANNQLLNTFLIALSDLVTFTKYNEFVMRIPNIIAYLLLAVFLLDNYRKEKISFLSCAFLVVCYPIVDFFSLARGYGISYSLTTIALLLFDHWNKDIRNTVLLFKSLIILSVGTTANTISLLVEAPVWIYVLLVLRKDAFKLIEKNRFKSAVVFGITAVSIVWHFWVSGDGSLYMDKSGGIISIIEGFFRFFSQRNLRILTVLYILLFCCSMVYDLIKKNYGSLLYRPMFFFFLMLCFLAVTATKKGYPTGRVLIPSYGLFVLSFMETCSSIEKLVPNYHIELIKRILAACCIICLIVSFFSQIDLKYSQFWGYEKGQKIKDDAYHAYQTKTKVDYSDAMTYYRNKILLEYGYDIYK